MGGLPRPDVPPGPKRDLVDALHDLHHRAGWPSLRILARGAGCSHTTVSTVFSSAKLPSWGTLELLVEAMDGDRPHFRELWLAASTPDDQMDAPAPRIAGRRDELAACRRHLETGTGLLLVTGEAGIGKTALVTTAASTVDRFVAVAHCRPLSTPVPLLPIADLLRGILDVDGGAWFAAALGACPPYVAEALPQVLPELDGQDSATVSAEFGRQRLLLAMRAILAALHDKRPLALLLEDLPWADAATLDVAELLGTGHVRFPVLATWRTDDPETDAAHDQWRARITGSSATLALEALTAEETAEQLTLLTGRPPNAGLVARIYGRSHGQPLFTEQLASQAATGDGLPSGLAELLARRLATLGEESWTIASALGIADRPLTPDQLARITGMTEGLDIGLRELGERRLLAGGTDPGVRVRHPLVAEAIRHRLAPGEGAQTRRRIARLLEETPDPPAAEIADHWQGVGDVGQEIVWRIRAARAAQDVFAGAQGAAQWARVLELWPKGTTTLGNPPVRLPEVWLAALDAVELTGDIARCLQLADVARVSDAAWQPIDRAELLRRIGKYRSFSIRPGTGLDPIEQALRIYRELPLSEGLVHALDQYATELDFLGRSEEADEVLGEALRAVRRLGDSRLERHLRATIAWQDALMGRMERAMAGIEHVASMQASGPDPLRDIDVSTLHTDIGLMACRPPEEIAAAARSGLHAMTRWEIATTESDTLVGNVAIAWMRSGAVTRAVEVLGPALNQPAVWTKPFTHFLGVGLDVRRGRLAAARARAASDINPGFAPHKALALCECDLWDGDPGAAFERVLGAFDSWYGTRSPGDAGEALCLAARAAADLANSPGVGRTQSRELLDRLTTMRDSLNYDPFGDAAVPVDRHAAPMWTAELARLTGKATVDQWVRAASEWDTVTRPHDAAYCRWRAAEVALRAGEGTLAKRLLKRAAHDAREHVPLNEAIRQTAAR